jgi:predicted phage terminase large subunit-like protein
MMQAMGASLLDSLLALTADEIEQMNPAEQAWVTRTMDRELMLRSPADFATALSRGLWKPYRHLVYISDAIVGMIENDDCDVLIVDTAVRHGKTELCSRWTPAWFNCKYRQRAGLASYEADFAATHGRRAREIVDEFGPMFGIKIDQTSHAAYRWDLEGGEGGMWAAGAGGPITGKGFMLGIVDDPIKGVEDAESAVMREKLWDWWQRVFLTRRDKIPGAKVMLIMSRWHDDDLTGRLLRYPTDGMRIKRMRLPAIAEDDDPLGRVPGQALCPERFDEVALAGVRSDIGPYAWASLYQQRPMLSGGGMFKREHFRYWSSRTVNEETWYQLGDHLVNGDEVWRFATMDTAYVRGKRSDFTVIATWGVAPTDPPSLILLDLRRVRVEAVDHAPLIEAVWESMQPAWVGIEKQMATLSMFDEAQRRGIVVRWLMPEKNKIARAETAAAQVQNGRVYLPEQAPWLAEFLDECLTFPVGKHDDQVDVLAYACIELSRRTVSPRRIHREPQTAADRMWERLERRSKQAHLHPQLGRFP